jgi:hypothetical protein
MTPRLRRTIGAVLVAYVALWILTAALGPRAVESRIHCRLEQRWSSKLNIAASVAAGRTHYPYFAVKTLSPAPFLLFSEYGSGTGPLAEEGGHSWCIWLFGPSYPVRTTLTWVS